MGFKNSNLQDYVGITYKKRLQPCKYLEAISFRINILSRNNVTINPGGCQLSDCDVITISLSRHDRDSCRCGMKTLIHKKYLISK